MKRSAKSGGAQFATTASAARRGLSRSTRLSDEQLQNIFLTAGRSLREGQSSKAEDLLRRSIEQHSYEADDFADLKRLLSFTLETVGRYKESLRCRKTVRGRRGPQPPKDRNPDKDNHAACRLLQQHQRSPKGRYAAKRESQKSGRERTATA